MPLNSLYPDASRPVPRNATATRAPMKYVPQMSLEERNRRWDRCRKQMLASGIDVLVFLGNDIFWGAGMANLRYMFQVDSASGAQAVFPVEGEPVVWNGIPHNQRPTNMYLSLQDWVSDVRCSLGNAAICDELKARGFETSRIGLVSFSSTLQPATLLHRDAVEFPRLLPEAEFVDASGILQAMRLVKSEAEIAMLRSAGKIARKVIDAMVDAARPGQTEAEVYAEMVRTQIANGAEPNIFNFFGAGPVDHPEDELWHLLHGCEQPLAPTSRPLAQGDIVMAEWHTKFGGYRCHAEYTVYIGSEPPAELMKIWDVSVEALEASRKALTVGRTIAEAVAMIREPVERAGYDFVELGFHAMGLASPEFPTVIYRNGYGYASTNGERIGDLVLEEGMCFGNNIDVHNARWKPDVGCMLSDFMVVREKEAECLVGTPTEIGRAKVA